MSCGIYVTSHDIVIVTQQVLYSSMEVGNSRNASFKVLVMFGTHYIRIHPARALGKTDRDLCQKRLFPVWTLWFVHLKCAVFVILFLCYCRFLVLMYRVVLIGVEFVEIHPDMSEGENKFILCTNRCSFIFNCFLEVAIPFISHILESFTFLRY